jgi:hypothetical protein
MEHASATEAGNVATLQIARHLRRAAASAFATEAESVATSQIARHMRRTKASASATKAESVASLQIARHLRTAVASATVTESVPFSFCKEQAVWCDGLARFTEDGGGWRLTDSLRVAP